MLKHTPSAHLFVAMLGICCLSRPAVALDCSKAKTPVEIAICTDGHLGSMDHLLSTQYFDLLREAKNNGFRRGAISLHDALQNDQRKWLAQRDKICNAETKDRVITCVSDSITKRQTDLEEIGQPSKGDTLTIGSETLVVAPVTPDQDYDDGVNLEYRGKVVVEGTGRDFGPPFTIVEHWSSPDADAILLDIGVMATLQCSGTYAVAASKRGLHVHDFGGNCIGFDMNEYTKTERGFTRLSPPTPTNDGETVEWDARSGEVTTKKLAFRPDYGTTMRGFVASKKPTEQEPLKNQEFFDAAGKLPSTYKNRVMAALWRVADDCPMCLDNAGRERYGVLITPDIAVFSGCGWFMYGAHLDCGQDDALAVWDKKSDAFFFAVEPHPSDSSPVSDAAVYVHPAVAEWPQAAKQKFELWRKGAKLVKRDK